MVVKNNNSKKISSSEYFTNAILIGLLIVLILSVVIFGIVYFIGSHLTKNEIKIYFCGDGTSYNQCSLNKPYFCKSDILYEKPSACGCPDGFKINGTICDSQLYKNSKIISLNYILRFEKRKINFIVYNDVYQYLSRIPPSINSTSNKEVTRSDFELRKIDDEIQRQAILPLVVKIENMYPSTKEDQARMAISLVQNIPYRNIEINISNNKSDVSKYPYQVLYDNAGSCEEKSQLLALILKELGYGTAIFYYPYENHEAVGIKCPIKYSLDNSGYCFVEATAPSIITDNKGYYLDGSYLNSKPIIIPISDGISLPSNLYEYYDARHFIKIRDKKGFVFLNRNLGVYLKEKYGMD